MTFRRAQRWLCVLTWVFLFAPACLLRAADTVGSQKEFDIPAAEADVALKAFAQQSGVELLYSTSNVEGVRTNAVRGRYLPREALTRMLDGTELVITQGRANNGLAVRRRQGGEGAATGRAQGGWSQTGSSLPAYGAATGTGSVMGRVRNAVTGQYLNNARIAVVGTNQVAFSDEAGFYRIANLPAGPVVLEVFYTGLDSQQISLELPAGRAYEQNVELTSISRYGSDMSLVRLDSFLVESSRETDSEAIAINEQRFAANIKNVISTESMGDPLGGNIGDFLRFLPGVAATDGALEADALQLRGFPGNMTVVSLDGSQLAGSDNSGGRSFTVSGIGVNSVSRVEVTKVPLPSTPADTMAGSVNMVSKSAFERSAAQLRYRAGLTSTERFAFKKTPSPNNRRTYKVYPDFDFDYTLPINRNLGIVITGLHSEISHEGDIYYTDYRSSGTGTTASPTTPYMYRHRNVESMRTMQRDSVSAKVDWRPTPNSVLSLSLMGSYYKHYTYNFTFSPTAGTNGTPTPSTGTPFSAGEDFVIGATGRGGVAMSSNFLNLNRTTQVGNARYRFDDGVWKIDTSVSLSKAKGWRRQTDRGFFNTMAIGLKMPVRVSFENLRPGSAGTFRAFDNNNQEVDLFDPNNYQMTTASEGSFYDHRSNVSLANLDVRRRFDVAGAPAAIQIGGLYKRLTSDFVRQPKTWNYRGINGDLSAAPYLDEVYYGTRKLSGHESMPYPARFSPYKAWAAYKQDPNLFFQTQAQINNTLRDKILASNYIEEDVAALYWQGEVRLLKNRLNVVTGVRYEKTTDDGLGPLQDPGAVFVRNPDGSFARDSAGNRIRRPEAGAAGSLQETSLIYQERKARATRSYDGTYPSLHLTYEITPNLLFRAAYAKTYGRPDFNNIIPNTAVDEEAQVIEDPDIIPGRLNVSNIGLRPWSADNYDISLEYYTDQGGLLGVGVFLKEVKDFFGSLVKIATLEDLEDLGLDARYVGWELRTQFNSGAATVKGAEVNVRHSLSPLGEWGKHVTLFANATKLELKGHDMADFTGFLPESFNWGATIVRRPFTLILKWNYRGEQRRQPHTDLGATAFQYIAPRTQLDASFSYQFRRSTQFYVNLRNVNDAGRTINAWAPETPAYARHNHTNRFGVVFTFGVKGSF